MNCTQCNQLAEVPDEYSLCPDCHLLTEERSFEIVELARAQHQEEGVIEIDDTAQLSEGEDNGCFVQAWVWVDFAETPFDKEKGSENG